MLNVYKSLMQYDISKYQELNMLNVRKRNVPIWHRLHLIGPISKVINGSTPGDQPIRNHDTAGEVAEEGDPVGVTALPRPSCFDKEDVAQDSL